MPTVNSLIRAAALAVALAQQRGKREDGPQLYLRSCNAKGHCRKTVVAMTMDSSWRAQHNASKGGWEGCIVGQGMWDSKLCPNPRTCAQRCAIDGLSLDQYANKHGIQETTGGIKMNYVTATKYGVNVGARIYMLDHTFNNYQVFKLKNREIAVDIDVSRLPCGTNAAIYLVAMDPDGGRGQGHNNAGARYGTGYCDARCQHSPNFMQGEANMAWSHGACCMEIDLFEGNREASAFTAHTCSHTGFKRCSHVACGDSNHGHHYEGICDKDGCDFNAFRMGSKDFYGRDKTVNTKEPFTVITQFITKDGTDDGPLSEIRRVYMLGSKVIQNSQSSIPGIKGDSIGDWYCNAQKKHFGGTRAKDNSKGDYNQFAKLGGMARLSAALDGGMSLAMSLWDDTGSYMRWLDSTSPKGHLGAPGAKRGPCPRYAGKPKKTRVANQRAFVTFKNVMYGPIGSTAKSKAKLQQAFSIGPTDVAKDVPQKRSGLALFVMGVTFATLVSFTALGLKRWHRHASTSKLMSKANQQYEQNEDMTQLLVPGA